MGFNLGLAALAANSYFDQGKKNRKDQVEQEEEAAARAARGRDSAYQSALDAWRSQQDQPDTSRQDSTPTAPPVAARGIQPQSDTQSGSSALMPAAKMGGEVFVRAAASAGLPGDNGTLNQIVELVNKGMSPNDAAVVVARKSAPAAFGGLAPVLAPTSKSGLPSAAPSSLAATDPSSRLYASLMGRAEIEFRHGKLSPQQFLAVKSGIAADFKSGAMDRLTQSAQAIQQKGVPVVAPPIAELDRVGASGAVGTAGNPLQDGIQGSLAAGGAAQLIEQKAADTINSPNASEEQKAYARDILDQIGRQKVAQQAAAQSAVAGQTRKPTSDEALTAAMDQAKLSDPQAYMAGRELTKGKLREVGANGTIIDETNGKVIFQNKIGMDEKTAKLQNDLVLQGMKADAALERVKATTESREAIASLKAEFAKIGGGSMSPKMQSIKYMEANPHLFTPQDIQSIMMERPAINEVDIATRLLQNDKIGDLKPEDAAAKAKALVGAIRGPAASVPKPKKLKYDPVTGGFK